MKNLKTMSSLLGGSLNVHINRSIDKLYVFVQKSDSKIDCKTPTLSIFLYL